MTKFDELKERFPNLIPVQELRSNVSIVELAVQYGYEPQTQKGKTRPVLEHPSFKDTIIIKNPQDAGSQVYQRAGDFTDSGTVIDFIRNRLSTVFSMFNHPGEHEFKNITSVLYDYLRIDPNHINQNRKTTAELAKAASPRQQFAKDQFDLRSLDENNYLTKRGIAPQTISRPEFTTKVVAQVAYFDPAKGHTDSFPIAKEHPERNYLTFTNVAFPYYNGISGDITGLELRNDNVKLHAPGSERYSSVFVSNPPAKPEQFFIMESAIDALSHQQLRSIREDDSYNSVYFSTGGQLTPHQVNTITRYIASFDKPNDWKINLGFDNDTKGHRYDLLFIQQLAATKYPMSQAVGGLGRYSYLLPEGEAYKPISEPLIRRVEAYNLNLLGQFNRTDQDTLGKAELSSQQFTISRSGNQLAIGIPDTCGALSCFSTALLNLTKLDQHVDITKAKAKDFNEDLGREIKNNEKFRYSLTDETGRTMSVGNVATLMARTLNHLRTAAESDGQTKTYHINERQPFGFHLSQVTVSIVEGQTTKSVQSTEFARQVQAEKKERSQNTTGDSRERKSPATDSGPQTNQSPGAPPEDNTLKRKH